MIAITPGEPGGIGPDIVLAAAGKSRSEPWVVIADADMLKQRAQVLGLKIVLDDNVACPSTAAGKVTVQHVPLAAPVVAGQLRVENAAGVLAALDAAIDGCLAQRFAALVTGPIQKSIIANAGYAFSGHTEYLMQRSASADVVMMLVADGLRVALATTHLPLRSVPAAITQSLLHRRMSILHTQLQNQFGLPNPRILVAGLNPHAGESGHLGDEEIRVIAPVCEQLVALGMDVVGPLPADTLFTKDWLDGADAVFAMYHDQGLPVLKALGFGQAVNVTLGLPFIRTSVDHGTALDIAGTGAALGGSFAAALALATSLSSACSADS